MGGNECRMQLDQNMWTASYGATSCKCMSAMPYVQNLRTFHWIPLPVPVHGLHLHHSFFEGGGGPHLQNRWCGLAQSNLC